MMYKLQEGKGHEQCAPCVAYAEVIAFACAQSVFVALGV